MDREIGERDVENYGRPVAKRARMGRQQMFRRPNCGLASPATSKQFPDNFGRTTFAVGVAPFGGAN